MLIFSPKVYLFCYVIGQFALHLAFGIPSLSGGVSANQGTAWIKSDCSETIISLMQLPDNQYFNGSIVEVVDVGLGPALYFRQDLSCDFFFAIPLPFSIVSLSYSGGYFYAIRDDGDPSDSTLYRIAEHDLVGGYAYWLDMTLEQCKACDPDDRPVYFDFNNRQETCNTGNIFMNQPSSQIGGDICTHSLDVLFAKERLSLAMSVMRSNSFSTYAAIKEEFENMYNSELSNNFHAVVWRWMSWTMYSSTPNRFTSVHAIDGHNSLFVNQPNFQPMQIDNFESPPKAIAMKPYSFHVTAITVYQHRGSLHLVGLGTDLSVIFVLVENNGTALKIDKLPHVFTKLFVTKELKLTGVDVFGDAYSSESFIRDVLLPLSNQCGGNQLMVDGKCMFYETMPLPFTAEIAEANCKKRGANYSAGTAKIFKISDSGSQGVLNYNDENALPVQCSSTFLELHREMTAVLCPSGCFSNDQLWGTGLYNQDSRICQAALHSMGEEISHYTLDSSTFTWPIGQQFCVNRSSDLCTQVDICPPNSDPVITGALVGDHWAPIRDSENNWVQVGDDHGTRGRICKSFTTVHTPDINPDWGITPGCNNPVPCTIKGNLYCCKDGRKHTVYHTKGEAILTGTIKNDIVSTSVIERGHYSFDPTVSVLLSPCPVPDAKFIRKCGSDGITNADCLALGCCPALYPSGYPSCVHPVLSGQKSTSDGWLKSIYGTYEYILIYHPSELTSLEKAREQCQEEGGDVAYASVFEENSWEDISNNMLQVTDSWIWIGLHTTSPTAPFMTLNNKTADYIPWNTGEPNGNEEYCAMIANSKVFDIRCSSNNFDLHGAMCQRVSHRCDLAVESLVRCGENIPFNAPKSTCLANGCCYVEPVNGEEACFRPNIKGSEIDVTSAACNWWSSTVNDFEYCLINPHVTWSTAKLKCLEQGGILAYEGFDNSSTFQVIKENVLDSSPNYIWFGAYYHTDGKTYNLKDEEMTWANYRQGEPSQKGTCLYLNPSVYDGYWSDRICGANSVVSAVCQRPKDPDPQTEASILCAKEITVLYCDLYAFMCHKNASCVETESGFQCLCEEGFSGDGLTCTPLNQCDGSWTNDGNNCYMAKVGVASFYEAELYCQEEDAHLVSIHSDEEYQTVKDLLQPYSSSEISFWIGLRRSLPWMSRNGEEYPGCGLWTDGTDCDFNDAQVDNLHYECYAYRRSSFADYWEEEMCALSLPLRSPSQVNGYICKKANTRPNAESCRQSQPTFKGPWFDQSGFINNCARNGILAAKDSSITFVLTAWVSAAPSHLTFSLTSIPWQFLPGGAQISINGKEVLQNEDTIYNVATKAKPGSIYLMTFDGNGKKVNALRMHDVSDVEDKLIATNSFMEDPRETYVVLVTSGRFDATTWEKLKEFLDEEGVSVSSANLNTKDSIETIADGRDLSKAELDTPTMIRKCGACDPSCDDVAIFRKKNDGFMTCRSYTDTLPKPSYTVKLEKTVTTSEPVISYRSHTMKNVSSSQLSCPWLSTGIETFGLKLVNIHEDKELLTSVAECNDPPCVHQVSCIRAPVADDAPDNDMTSSYVLLCEKLGEGNYNCPINRKNVYTNGSLHSSYSFSGNVRAPFLATFDDLLYLGSPPFEFGSVYGRNLTWRPLHWTWTSDRYGSLVTGVQGKAIRFSNCEVSTVGDFCYSNVDDENVCSNGLTLSFWIRVVKWPSNEHQNILNTGAFGVNALCKGIVVYLNSLSTSLLIHVRTSQANTFVSHTIVLHKWTHVWFSWSQDAGIEARYDWTQPFANENLQAFTFVSASRTDSCNGKRLSFGSTIDTGGVFDLDNLQIFSRSLEAQNLLSNLLEPALPLRYVFLGGEETVQTTGSHQLLDGEPCSESWGYVYCGTFEDRCPGSLVHCKHGFNLAFSIVLPLVTSNEANYQHVVLASNVPHQAIWTDTSKLSFGFRIFVSANNGNWDLFFRNYVDFDFKHEFSLKWELGANTPYTFWVQYHPDGRWLICVLRPYSCQEASSKSYDDFDDDFAQKETSYEFLLGPVAIVHDGSSYTASDLSDASLYNVWFAEEGFDLVMFADEVSKVPQPFHWQPYTGGLKTDEDQVFQIKGDATRVSFGYNATFGARLSISNTYSDLQSLVEIGHKIETLVGWLEMTPESYGADSCLFDIDQCTEGFTVQFWIKAHKCEVEVSGGNCYYVSSGGQGHPVLRGFAFYYSPDDQCYHVTAASSRLVREAKFKADLGSDFVLVRIINLPTYGLLVYLNDIPIPLDAFKPLYIIQNAVNSYSFNPILSITLGKRNDLQEGFTSFEIADFQFWDKTVYGMPFQTIGKTCMEPWHQIGENCYLKVDDPGNISEAKDACSEFKAELAHVPSLASYQAFKRYIFSTGSNSITYWIGAEKFSSSQRNINWPSLQLQQATLNFNAFVTGGADLVSLGKASYGRTVIANTGRNEIRFENYKSTLLADGYVCAYSVKDPFLQGCYEPISDDSKFQFDSTKPISLHRFDSSASSFSANALASYEIPLACRRYCNSKLGSSVSAISLQECFCLNAATKLLDFIAESETLRDAETCAPTDKLIAFDSFQRGFPVLNPLSSTSTSRLQFCGSIETGGMYKCGSDSGTFATVYGSNDLEFEDASFAALPAISLKILTELVNETYSATLSALEPITISVVYPFCESPCFLSSDGETCDCSNYPIWLQLTFGNDGDEFETYVTSFKEGGLNFTHYYNHTGNYTLLVKMSNERGSIRSIGSGQFTVIGLTEKVEIKNLLIDPIVTGGKANLVASFLFGDEFACDVSFGDGTPDENHKSSGARMLNAIKHQYSEAGIYDAQLTCQFLNHLRSIQRKVVVQQTLVGLRAETDVLLSHGDTYEHKWDLIQGSHGSCKVFFGNESLEERSSPPSPTDLGTFYFDSESNQGIAMISTPQNENYGFYTVVVTCYNSVTAALPSAVTYLSFDVSIGDVQLTIANSIEFVRENVNIPLSLNIDSGSNFLIRWNWDEASQDEVYEFCDGESCTTKSSCVAYEKERDYTITVDVINILGVTSSNVTVYVERPIENLVVDVLPGETTLQPTEIALQFDDDFHKGHLRIDYGDGVLENIFVVFGSSSKSTSIYHRYTKLGFNKLQLQAYNNVSSSFQTFDLQIGTSLEGLTLSVFSARILQTKYTARFYVRIEKGSDPVYELDFGEGSSNRSFSSTRLDPNLEDTHYIDHVYHVPGNYVASASVENVFGRLQAVASESVIVQNPLGNPFSLKPLTIGPVPYPPGSVSFNCELVKDGTTQESDTYLTTGWANNVHVKWYLSKPESNHLLLESYGDHDIDIFPATLFFTREDVGGVLVVAELSNLVSSATLHYSFQVFEVIEGLKVVGKNLDLPTEVDLVDLEASSIDAALSNELLFVISAALGSHITFIIDYGDGNVDLRTFGDIKVKDATFRHTYNEYGQYSVNVTVENEVGSIGHFYSDVIAVFEEVEEVTSRLENVHFDSDNVYDIFQDSSELFALSFGSTPLQRDDLYYTSVNRSMSIFAGTMKGSNVSLLVEFLTANITVEAKYLNGLLDVQIQDELADEQYVSAKAITENGILKVKLLKKQTPEQLGKYASNAAARLDTNEYVLEAWLLLQYQVVGRHVIRATASNKISRAATSYQIDVHAPVSDVAFLPLSPPVANKTVNISITAKTLGTESCFVIDPGDFSRKIGFGFNRIYCLENSNLESEHFYQLTQNPDSYLSKNVSHYEIKGDVQKGDSQFNFTFQHIYTNPAFLQIKVLAFNRISSVEISTDVTVTELLCDYPSVQIEKHSSNSLESTRQIRSFLKFQIYTAIRLNCKITSSTSINWYAYEMVKAERNLFETDDVTGGDVTGNDVTAGYVTLPSSAREFSSSLYKYRSIAGLSYTSKSEDISFPARFLKPGLYLICVNVAMLNVPGLNTTDCIYVSVILPPLVAGFNYGLRRAVRYRDVLRLDAISASYDPDIQNLADVQDPSYKVNPSSLIFRLSCPFVVNRDSADQASFDEKLLMFEQGSVLYSGSFCGRMSIYCPNSLHVIKILRGNYTIVNLASTISNDLSNLKTTSPCNELNSCNFSTNVWLSDYFEQLQLDPNDENITSCVDLSYQCAVSEHNEDFLFLPSSYTCIPPGYYPIGQDPSKAKCSSILTIDEKTCGLLEIDSSLLDPNESYMIRVMVYGSGQRSAISSQVVEFFVAEPPKLRINCDINCGVKVNPEQSIVTSVSVRDEEGRVVVSNSSLSIAYTWVLYEVVDEARKRRDTTLVDEELFEVEGYESFAATGIHDHNFVIEPGLLQPSILYRIRVIGNVEGRTGLTETELSINLPPYDGDCSITPNEGIAMNDTFTVTCSKWKDEGIGASRKVLISPNDYSLIYQIYYYTNEDDVPALLFYGSAEEVSGLFLPPGQDENDNRVWIQVRIIDEFGGQALVNLSVQVHEAPELSEEALENLTATEVATSSLQNVARLSASVSGILNKKTNANGTAAASATVTGGSSEAVRRARLRAKLVEAILEKSNPEADFDGMQLSSSAMSSLTSVSDEVDNDVQISVLDNLSNITNRLSVLSETSASEDVYKTSSVIVSGVDNVVKAARQQALKNAPTVDSNSNSVPNLPQFSLPEEPERSPFDVIDEEESYLSPEERQVRRRAAAQLKAEEHYKKTNQSKRVGNSAVAAMSQLSASTIKRKVPGEPAVKLQTNGVAVEAQKNTASQLCEMLSQNKTFNKSASTLAAILRDSFVTPDDCNDTSNDETIDAMLVNLDDNPYIWDGSADSVRSSVVSLEFKFPNGSKPYQGSNNTFRIELNTSPSLSAVSSQTFNFSPSGEDNMAYHELTYDNFNDVIFFTVTPESEDNIGNIHMRVFFLHALSLKTYPSVENFTFYKDLPQSNDPENGYRIRLDQSSLMKKGRYVFGILQTDIVGNITAESNRTLLSYTLYTLKTKCQFWNESTEKWETTGCVVSSETRKEKIVCLCNHLTSFGADFVVAPNPIDFAELKNKLANLKDNLAVLMTIVGLLIIYVVGIIFCRRQDKKDLEKWAVALLMDNSISDEYFYQITVFTGSRLESETSSRIFFILNGDKHQTPLRILAEKENTKFDRGSERKFLMSVDEPLGHLSFLKIWHDNSGKRSLASWFLNHVVVTDLSTGKRNYFMCDDWLAVDQSDGQVERILPVASDSQMVDFKRVFSTTTKKDFSDGHLWFSLFSRPNKSNFTRVQRLTCAITVLFSTMLASAMFYGRGEEDEDEDGDSNQQGVLQLGPFKFTVQQLVISIEASLVVLPVNLLLVQLFRRAKSKKTKEEDDEDIRNLISKSDTNMNEEKKEKNSGGFQFPYWAVYVAWTVAAIIVAVSATFVFLYSVDWGATKSNEWLLSIFFSFFQSLFVIQPVKVIVTAVLLSVFINRCARDQTSYAMSDEDEEQNVKDMEMLRKNEEEWLLQTPMDDELEDLKNRDASTNQAELEEARQKRMKHKVMISTIHDILSYILYILLLTTAANSSRDLNSYRFHQSLSEVFLEKGSPLFLKIRTPEDVWSWCENSLIVGLHASSWYNQKRVTWAQTRFIKNRESFVLGPARIRQLRVKNRMKLDTCDVKTAPSLTERSCIADYNILTQETSDYLPGWMDSDDAPHAISPWTYQTFLELEGFPYNGKLNLYDGGGYAFTLGNTANSSRKKLEEMKQQDWIDRHTAAIFVEFTVYNANINLFGSAVLLLERSANGAFLANPVFTPLRLYDFIDGKGTFITVIYILFVIVFAYNLVKTIGKIAQEKKAYFKQFWNILDFVIILFSLFAIAMYAGRTIHVNATLGQITADINKETFVNFQYIVLWNELFQYSIAFTLFFATIKLSKLLHFNRRIRLLSRTLRHAAKPILSFSAMFYLYFIAFICLSHVWFEKDMYVYSTVYLTGEELFSMLLGRFDFTQLKASDRLLGPFFFLTFTGLLTLLLLNMFIVILDQSFKKARLEMEQQSNQFEVMDYITDQLFSTLKSYIPKILLPGQEHSEDDQWNNDGPVYVEYPEDVLELRVRTLAEHVNKLEVDYFNSISENELLIPPELDDSDCDCDYESATART